MWILRGPGTKASPYVAGLSDIVHDVGLSFPILCLIVLSVMERYFAIVRPFSRFLFSFSQH